MDLENVIRFSKTPTIIIDCRVLVFRIISYYKKYKEILDKDLLFRKDWIFANWSLIINDPIPYLKDNPSYNVILVDDTRFKDGSGYWRNWLFPLYKANRDPLNRDSIYFEILESIYQYLDKSTIDLFKEEGFEADDFAGLAYRCKTSDSPLVLFSVDTDWLQLVSDSKNILFCCSSGHTPKLRSEYEVIIWANRKGYLIKRPQGIVDMKKIYGDSSDNIPENYGKDDIISLINPYLFPSEENKKKMDLSLNKSVSNQNKSHLKYAQQWLAKYDCMP